MGPNLQGDLHPGVQAPCPDDYPGILREPRGCKSLTLSSGPDGSRGQGPAQREASLPAGAHEESPGLLGLSAALLCTTSCPYAVPPRTLPANPHAKLILGESEKESESRSVVSDSL